jgi:hypothetical protein
MTIDVVIVANYSTPELKRMTEECVLSLRQSEKEHSFNITVQEDKGSDFNYNLLLCSGLSKGNGEWVILSNNDCIYHNKFFSMILMAHENGVAESFGCWNPNYHEKYLKKEQSHYYGYRTSIEMTGWVIVTTRSILKQINFCSEENQRVSFFYSDNIYGDLLKKHNIKHALIRNSKVTHLLNQTLKTHSKEKQLELTKGQKQKYLTGIK